MKGERTWWWAGALAVYLVVAGAFVASRWEGGHPIQGPFTAQSWAMHWRSGSCLLSWGGWNWGLLEFQELNSDGSPVANAKRSTLIVVGSTVYRVALGTYQFLVIITAPFALAVLLMLRSITRRLRLKGHADGKSGDT